MFIKWFDIVRLRNVCLISIVLTKFFNLIPMLKKSTEFFQSVRIFPTIFVWIFEKVIWEHCCTLFVVCRQFSQGGRFFFSTKKYFVFVDETTTPTQILHKAYGEKPVTFYTLFPVCHFFVVPPLFRCCSRIVYSERVWFFRAYHIYMIKKIYY